MGYYMNMRGEDFYMSLEDKLKAFPIVKASLLEERKTRTSPFSWVYDEEIENAQSLDDILDAFRWTPDLDAEGNTVSICFDGDKLGEDKIVFSLIAPFVQDDSYIEMNGEEGAIWRWVFQDGKCIEKDANISFE